MWSTLVVSTSLLISAGSFLLLTSSFFVPQPDCAKKCGPPSQVSFPLRIIKFALQSLPFRCSDSLLLSQKPFLLGFFLFSREPPPLPLFSLQNAKKFLGNCRLHCQRHPTFLSLKRPSSDPPSQPPFGVDTSAALSN